MKEIKYSNVIGLMSGTSADGIDVSIVNTNGITLSRNKENLIYPYSQNTKEKLRYIMNNTEHIWERKSFLKELELSITNDHIDAVNFVKNKFKITPSLIGFHGQTILHDIQNKISIQLGDGHLLSKKTNCKVIFDFRSQDIKNGGQGAPLAPVYHKFILNKIFGNTCACFINIGGVSNISYVYKDEIQGFDSGPGCGLMDQYIQENLNKDFDKNGKFSSKGKANEKLIKKILKNPFFEKPPPKSIDKFEFKNILSDKEFLKLNFFDGMATLCHITAETISIALDGFDVSPEAVLISGGGRHNNFLMHLIRKKCNLNIYKVEDFNLNGDFIESELIAYLAVRSLNQLPSTYPSTTGTNFPTICGRDAS